jgi:dTDP-4-dehydrorhamnose 3,5-epimerase-like enzyme
VQKNIYKIVHFNIIGDELGSLIALENMHQVPFEVKRVYYIFDTKSRVRRGMHAHRDLEQLCFCVKGSCTFVLDDGTKKDIIKLDSPNTGLYIKNLIWREMFDFSKDCVLVVLANKYYDPSDYIRDYKEFKRLADSVKQAG